LRTAVEYIIYTDESDKRGKYYSNFYGGVLVRSLDIQGIVRRLERCKAELRLHREVKWQKVTANYLEKYKALMDAFFQEVGAGRVKVRIMFTQNLFVPSGLTPEQRRNEYYLLYYQFIKHAFGLRFSNPGGQLVRVRLNLDRLPGNGKENARFRGFILGLNKNPELKAANIHFSADQIAELRSHDHVLLQCLDVVLGAMAFRLNDKHKAKRKGKRRRGNRTIAKHELYKHIQRLIQRIYPGFNVGVTTGRQGAIANLWHHPYRHWKFVPKHHRRDPSQVKP